MDLSLHEDDPDSGRPTSRLDFNPSEMATSTPIPSSRRQSRLRSHSALSFRPTSPTGIDYRTVNGVIQVVKENRQLREENDELRDQSMTSNHELNESRAKISELEEQVKTFTFELPTIDVRTAKVESDQWNEERKQLEDEKEEMEKKLKETKEEMEKKLKETNEEMEKKLKETKEELNEKRKQLEDQKEKMEKELKETNEELDEEKRKTAELQAKFEKVVSEKDQIVERTTVTIKRTEESIKEREEEMQEEWKRKEEVMEEERMKMEKEMEEMKEKMKSNEAELGEERRMLSEKEGIIDGLMEEKKKMEEVKVKNEEMEKEMEALREKIGEMENELNTISTEGERILSLEKKIRELERKTAVAEEELISANNRYEEMKAVREDEMKETLASKTKVHEQRTTIDNLNRVNGELEEKKREGMRLKEQLNEKNEEVKKMKNEMDQLKADVAKRREVQKRLEDELDIARKLSKDAADEMNRMGEDREKEKEEGRMEWMSKELRDNEEVRKTMEKEREESEKRMNELVADRDRYFHLSEELKQQFQIFQDGANLQYSTDMATKDEEIHAMRERLAEFENYPGRLVSVDGRYSEGRSVYDLFPSQLKDFVDRTKNDSVRRAVDCCKSMIIRGPIDNREEKREEAPPTLAYLPILIERLEEIELPSLRSNTYLAFIVRMFKKMEGEEGTEALIASLASNIEEEMIKLDSDLKELEKRSKKNEENGEKLRRSMEENGERLRRSVEEIRRLEEGIRRTEEERRKFEEEAIRADDERKKALNEMMILRGTVSSLKKDKYKLEETAHGFKEVYEKRDSELNEAEDKIDQLEERCQELEREMTDKTNEKDRMLDWYRSDKIETEKKLEYEIAKNAEQSRKCVEEANELQRQEKETRAAKKEIDRLSRGKQTLRNMIREMMDGLAHHYRVYFKVRERNERRQILLDHCVKDIDEIIRSIEKGKLDNVDDVKEKLERIDQKIRIEITDYLVADAIDYKECKAIRKKIDDLEKTCDNV